MPKELVIYCDESEKEGVHFSNFYGGALVRSDDIDEVREAIARKKLELNLHGEVKWSKITQQYMGKYISLMDAFFDLVQADAVKIRVMFTQNRYIPTGLTPEQRENEYYLLYYQFLKHSFGLKYANDGSETIRVRIYLDEYPDTQEKRAGLKSYLARLTLNPEMRQAKLAFPIDQITSVVSHEHNILQCVDVILGAIHFRLNDLHKVKPRDARIRGKRTRAKEKVYKHILKRVREIYPNFNIGITTGTQGDLTNRWHHSYRHWLLVPKNHEIEERAGKKHLK